MMPYLPTKTHFDMQRETMGGISNRRTAAPCWEARPDPLGMAWVGLLTKLQALRGFRPSNSGRVGVRRPA
jgi:hypothetical protein